MITTTQENEGVELTCQRCQTTWNYRGTNQYVATCPYCKTTVQVRKGVAQ